jgi:S1-C subfamily serine protease
VNGRICVSALREETAGPDAIAVLHRNGDGHYALEAVNGNPVWVNGRRTESKILQHRDMIEFSERGPMSRYYLYGSTHRIHGSLAGIFNDAAAYLRNSRQPFPQRLLRASGQAMRRLVRETTILFRIAVVTALVVLALVVFQQNRVNRLQKQQIESGIAELENFSRVLAQSQSEKLTPGDLEALQSELENRMSVTSERLARIERRSAASARVIAMAAASVVFIQGAYGFRDEESGKMLRHVLGEDGKPLLLSNGLPLLSLDGDGEVAERQYTGTGFALGDEGQLVTNRHIGLPWEKDANMETLAARGLEPVMVRFLAYVPGVAEPADLVLVGSSSTADIALLRFLEPAGSIKGLRLAERQPKPGDEVIVMGYPTGLRALLAQAGSGFIEKLKEGGETGFWSIAESLAASGRIAPLASRGIIGRVSDATIAYDAETTHGGSGGPVLDIDGAVVAVNSAILPEYGGSNLGVPVVEVRKLLDLSPSN